MRIDAGREEGPGVAQPGGFWRRFLALAVDFAVVSVLWALGGLVGAPLAGHDLPARAFAYTNLLVVPGVYFVLAHGTGGRTLGKLVFGVRVVGAGGEAIGYPRALARYAGSWVSLLLLGAGYLMVALRGDKRALHDLVAGTRVVRVR